MPTPNETSSAVGSGGSASWSHTTSGSDRYLVVGVGTDSDLGAVSTKTYASVTLDDIGSNPATGPYFLYSYGRHAPTAGANTVALTYANSVGFGALACSFNATLDSGAPGTPLDADDTEATKPTQTLTSAADRLAIGLIFANNDDHTSLSEAGGQTRQIYAEIFSDVVVLSTKAGASSVSLSWTGNFEGWENRIFDLKPSAGAAPTPPTDYRRFPKFLLRSRR